MKQDMNQYKYILRLIFVALFLSFGGTQVNANEQNLSRDFPQITAALATLYMTEEIQLIRGTSVASLDLAQYQDTGPLVAVIIAEDLHYFYLYLENCDVCSVLARSKKDSGATETIKQSHQLSGADLKSELMRFGIKTSVIDTANR